MSCPSCVLGFDGDYAALYLPKLAEQVLLQLSIACHFICQLLERCVNLLLAGDTVMWLLRSSA